MGVSVITIRPFESSDIRSAVALETEAQPVPWTEGVFRDEISAENRVYLIAESEDTIIGFGGMMLVGDDAHVTNLLVAPEHRRTGVGKQIMIDLIRAAIAGGARHLTLEVRSSDLAARRFYTRFGFAPVGVRSDYYGDDDALIMWVHDIDLPDYLERLG